MQTPEQSPSDQAKPHPRLAKSFSQVAAATVASKVVGLIRDVIVGKAYGTSIVADAYQYAYLLTGNFFVMFGGLGGPFDTCTVTVLDSKSEEQRPVILRKLLKSTYGAFALGMGTGAWAALNLSNRLVQLPLGVLVTAMIVPMLPRFTRSATTGNFEKLRSDFERSVRFLWFTTLPILAVFCALAKDIVRVLFEGGQFKQDSVDLVTLALIFQLPSMFFYVARDLMTRVFYAFRDTHTPFRIACLTLVLKAIFDAVFVLYYKMDVAGISLSTSLVTAVNFVVLICLLKKQRNMGLNKIILPTLGMAVGAIICWFITAKTMPLVGQLIPQKISGFIPIAISALAGLFAYAATCWAFRIEDMKLVISQLLLRK